MNTLTIPRQHYDDIATLLKSKFKVIATEDSPLCTDIIEVAGEPVMLMRAEVDGDPGIVLAT